MAFEPPPGPGRPSTVELLCWRRGLSAIRSSAQLSADVLQLSPENYTSPAQIPAGSVVVVGDGATGRQIAQGNLLHRRGVSPVAHLNVLGRSWQWTPGPALLTGVGDDALYLTKHMLHHLGRDKIAVSLAVWRQQEERELYDTKNGRLCGVPRHIPAGIGGKPHAPGWYSRAGFHDEMEGRV